MSDTANQHANGLRINANVFRAAFKEARVRQLEHSLAIYKGRDEAKQLVIEQLERQLKERDEELAELRRSVDKLNEAVDGAQSSAAAAKP